MRTLRPTFVAPARVAWNAEAIAHVGTPLRGRVVDIKVKQGSAVAAGDALLVVDSPDLGEAQSDFLVKRSAAKASAPLAEFAKEDWERGKALFAESQGISQGEVHRREADYSAALATVKGAEAAATAAENRLHMFGMAQPAVDALAASSEIQARFTITAPLAGQVIARNVTLGELVAPDRESLLTIVDPSVLWVLAEVPEARLSELALGARAQVRVSGTGAVSFDGKVSFVSPMLEESTRTAQVRIEVGGANTVLRPGMFAEAKIVAGAPGQAEPASTLSVPETAVQSLDRQPVVFVLAPGEPRTFAKRAVSLGRPVDGFVPILAGLRDGEQVVTNGSFILKAQAQVVAEAGK
jgi:cobalt-zinc-cadmium efflux system membrane fusion protein